MKKIQFIAAIFAALITTAAAQPTRTLICRGGPSMRIAIFHDINAAGIPTTTHMTIDQLKPISASAILHPPNSGECAWRLQTMPPMSPPTVIHMKPSDKIEFTIVVMGNGELVRDTRGPLLMAEGALVSAIAQEWHTVVHAVLNEELFTVKVYDEGWGWIVAQVEKP